MTLTAPPLRQALSRDQKTQRLMMAAIIAILSLSILFPLYAILSKSLENKAGDFIGADNFVTFLTTPALYYSFTNSLWVALLTTAIVLVLAFFYAFALTRTCMPFKPVFKVIAFIPLLSPSLLSGISLVYWFGNKGVAKGLLFGESIYGPVGIIIGSAYWVFPHVLIILLTALALSDGRLYEAATALRTGRWRSFVTITLSGAKYGIISAGFVAFTLIFTDFGVPKVIGGNFNMLATDVYKQVIGQQNFQMGAVVSVVLLIPAAIAFAVDRSVQKRQVSVLGAKSVPYVPKPERGRDLGALAFCTVVALMILALIGMAQYAALVTFWPYNLELGFGHYDFDRVDDTGWRAYWNSLELGLWTAIFGTVLVVIGAYLVEKVRDTGLLRTTIHGLSMAPLAVPGMVLGLAYIFFFNHPDNPFGFLYGGMGILVLVTVIHFYTVPHLTVVTALKQMDCEFDSVAASLKTPFYKMIWRVTLPVNLPAIFDVSIYFFLNAMTTVSAAVFLYSSDTKLASIAVLNRDDAGNIAAAAAMAMMIVYTCAAVRLLHAFVGKRVLQRSQSWRSH